MLPDSTEKNAETIFGAIGDEIEKAGVHLLDARAFMDEDLAEEGAMVKGKEKIEAEHLTHGIEIARENARLDVGQGVVAGRGTVLAVEAFEGTSMPCSNGRANLEPKCSQKTRKPSRIQGLMCQYLVFKP